MLSDFRRRSRGAFVTVFAGFVLSTTPSAQAAPRLAGLLDISARDTAAMLVTLPTDLSFQSQQPSAMFEGDDKWKAVALYSLATVSVGKSTFHPSLVIADDSKPNVSPSVITDPTLPAGVYVLVASSVPGSKVHAQVTLPDLDGSATLTPGTPFPLRHWLHHMRDSQVEANTRVVSGIDRIRGAGFGAINGTVLPSDPASGLWVGSVQLCEYDVDRDDAPGDGEPGCPGASTPPPSDPLAPLRLPNAYGFSGGGGGDGGNDFWSLPRPPAIGRGFNYHTDRGTSPNLDLESWWVDFADMPAGLLERTSAARDCAADAGAAPSTLCSSFAPFRRARQESDRIPRALPSSSARRYSLEAKLTRRIASTRMGPLFLAPGLEGSCALMFGKDGASFASCVSNVRLLRGELAFELTGSGDRTLVAAILPDGAHHLRLRLRGRARGSVRRRGNAAIAYTSYRRYRGGTLRWRDHTGRSRVTKLPFSR